MTDPQIHVDIDCTTGERTVRELTSQEIAEREQILLESQAAQEQVEAALAAKVAAKESAITKLKAQGYTDEEIAALYS